MLPNVKINTFLGKSNFMDAISFVMGEKTQPLRAKRMSDLIHGASVGKPFASRAHVTAVFETANGKERKFTRSIIGSSADHKIDERSVTGLYIYFKENLLYILRRNSLVAFGIIQF